MNFAEIKDALATLSPEQRAELEERLHALDEGVTVEELREINAMLQTKKLELIPSAWFHLGGGVFVVLTLGALSSAV